MMAKKLLATVSLVVSLAGLARCNDVASSTDTASSDGGDAGGVRGAACAVDGDCADGLACFRVNDRLDSPLTIKCDGVDWFGARRCFPAEAGTSCSGPGECAEGLTCVVQTATDSVPSACLPLGMDGDGCCTFATDPFGNSLFTIDSTCGAGLSCGEASECVVANDRRRGLRCESDDDCASGLECVRVFSAADLSGAPGCAGGYTNNWFGLARCLEPGTGAACEATAGCREGLTCVMPNDDMLDDLCLPLGRTGDTCCVYFTEPGGASPVGIESTCEEEFYCDSTGQCIPR